MQPSHKGAEGDFLFDELNAVVGMIRRRRVIDRQKHPGQRLQQEDKKRGRAEHIDPARAAGDRLVEQCALQSFELQAAIEPLIESRGHRSNLHLLREA